MIRFRMVKINVDQFAILIDKDKVPTEGLSYTVNLGFSIAPDVKGIACGFSVEFAHNNKPILKLSISCEFSVHPEDWNTHIKDNIFTLSTEDLGFFANQTVGSARGIMFCKTEDTDFRNFILPPIDLTKIIDDDLVIDLAHQ